MSTIDLSLDNEYDQQQHPDKRFVEDWLNRVVYGQDEAYTPSTFALEFITFIKLVNGEDGEENKTPVVHYKMLDQISGKKQNICNMCHRGLAKTTIMGEYLFLYIAVYGGIPGFGKVPLALYVSDSIENGVKNMRKNLEYRWENSSFLQKYVPTTRFTDVRYEFTNIEGNTLVIKGYGGKALSLDSVLYTDSGTSTIGACKVGDKIFGADGYLATITQKSEIFNKPMYEILLEDKRTIKVSEDHINSIVHKENVNNTATYTRKDLYTHELLDLPLLHTRTRKRKDKPSYVSNENLLFIENCKPLEYTEKEFPLDPYTLGLLLGDGSMKKDGGSTLHGHKDDMEFYYTNIPYELGTKYVDKRNTNVVSTYIRGITQVVKALGVNVHGDHKFVPDMYLYGSIEQRLALLQGLMDTDGCASKNGRCTFSSNSIDLIEGVKALTRSLGGTAISRQQNKAFSVEIWLEYVPFKLPRKAIRFKNRTKHLVAIKSITRIDDEPSQCIAIDNEEHQFLTDNYFRTHNTGVRGSKEMGQRPYLAVLDDLISDDDARSPTVIASIEDTVYKAIDYALHPTRRKTIWSGTPFNASDPLYKAVESGAWYVNVYPVCEKFPCTREEFKGSWEDRFDYDYVLAQYTKALKAGKIDTFNQEMMLRIMSDEDRLVQDADIVMHSRDIVLKNKSNYNFYITTDFATSEKTSADYSVISVWAYSSNNDWLLVDGSCARQLMDTNIDMLFGFVSKYKPLSVGIEVTGQQGGFIPWIKKEMQTRNIYFNLACNPGSNQEGIRPNTNKLVRFNTVLPLFKNKKIMFPEELNGTPFMVELLDELRNVAASGFKSKHDDVADTISMLMSLTPYTPSVEIEFKYDEDSGIYAQVEEEVESNSNYVF